MKSPAFIHWLVLAVFCLLTGPGIAGAEGRPLTGKEKIEILIAHVEGLKGATFIRNGTEYDAATAAKFLRGKWKAGDKAIKTAADFITKAASVSSTSGKPYLIRLKDGKETKCGEYLTAQLKGLEKASPTR